MNRQRLLRLLIAVGLILIAWSGIIISGWGLNIRSVQREGLPMIFITPKGATDVPGVLIAHGFAGSKQLMLGYGYTLAHDGYGVLLWDFNGHGANPQPFEFDSLSQNLATAYSTLIAQPEIDPQRLALIGHSMGSNVAMSAASENPAIGATIALSPVPTPEVNPQTPRNLQLQAGSWEPSFVATAQKLLAQAGGENLNPDRGSGRSLVIIPRREHITILFSYLSHQAAKSWLNQTFNRTTTSSYRDLRFWWYSLHLVGWLLLISLINPGFSRAKIGAAEANNVTKPCKPIRNWLGLLLAPLGGIISLILIDLTQELDQIGGLLVGGILGIWLLAAGIVWLVTIAKIARPTIKELWWGIWLFILLWLTFSWMAQFVWLQAVLIPTRVGIWLGLSLACLPWFLASGMVQQRAKPSKLVLWWLVQSIVLVLGLGITAVFVPEIRFIILILPIFPLFIALIAYGGSQIPSAWSYGIGGALFFAWAIAITFPLVN